jgi:transposase
MVFGAISGSGTGPLHRCTGNVNAHVYRDILELHQHYFHGKKMVQDNAPCHRAHLVTDWMSAHNMDLLPWPAYSPDLNPIENLWSAMKSRVQGQQFPTKDALWSALEALWNAFSTNFVRLYIDSMPRRISAVIAAKGGSTIY